MKLAINGAGIAGSALAYWLARLRHEVLLIEKVAALRTGGYVLNLWGVGYDVAEKMGLLPGSKHSSTASTSSTSWIDMAVSAAAIPRMHRCV